MNQNGIVSKIGFLSLLVLIAAFVTVTALTGAILRSDEPFVDIAFYGIPILASFITPFVLLLMKIEVHDDNLCVKLWKSKKYINFSEVKKIQSMPYFGLMWPFGKNIIVWTGEKRGLILPLTFFSNGNQILESIVSQTKSMNPDVIVDV